jgi:hypothetical protein
MSSIPANALPTPSLVSVAFDDTLQRSPPGHVGRWRVVDEQVRVRVWTFTWLEVPAAVAAAVRAHHEDHGLGTFILAVPRTGENVRALWMGEPQVQWRSAKFARSVVAQFEEALIP